LVERDFLERFNKNLKAQCESLTKEILVLKAAAKEEPRKTERNIYTAREDAESKGSRNSSNELGLTSKRKEFLQWKRDKSERGEKSDRGEKGGGPTLKNSLSASGLREDYYGGRSSRALKGRRGE
jgi:hypothetical protein